MTIVNFSKKLVLNEVVLAIISSKPWQTRADVTSCREERTVVLIRRCSHRRAPWRSRPAPTRSWSSRCLTDNAPRCPCPCRHRPLPPRPTSRPTLHPYNTTRDHALFETILYAPGTNTGSIFRHLSMYIALYRSTGIQTTELWQITGIFYLLTKIVLQVTTFSFTASIICKRIYSVKKFYA